MHPKVIAHRKKVATLIKEKRNQDQHRNVKNMSSPRFLVDTVSESTLPRVYQIYDALIKAIEPLGCTLTDELDFVINGETVRISISESQDKIDHILTREENIEMLEYEERKRRYSWASKPNIRKYDYIFNGKITINIDWEKSFRDCKTYVIEDRLGDILVMLYEASDSVRKVREKREAEERKRQEEEKLRKERMERYNLEIERTTALVNEANDFDIALKIRAYVSAVVEKKDISQEEADWILWAKQKADWYDPTIKYKDDFLGVREHSKDANHKKLEKAYHSWRW
jgi:hypothetical protein